MLGAYGKVQYLYEAGIDFVRGRLEALNNEFRVRHSHNPIHHIQSRVKTPQSISLKLKKSGIPVSMTNAKKNLRDIAGVRVICCYVEDIFTVAQLLTSQDDVQLIEEKNYIKHPKENGYRSLHLVVDVPVYLSEGKVYIPVEVQIRTVAMDFWASLEHNLRYKAEEEVPLFIVDELKKCADVITETDARMEQIFHAMSLLRDRAPKEPPPQGGDWI
ncbi:MAG: GTP pyrophosphokinase family protein [Clostridia bacterium]|nr:GTP pyrophosphokinase family protein [Clostridia bacterium]MBO4885079.1 GTP pyrophosphokinase family protein [Clostridia bacterium]